MALCIDSSSGLLTRSRTLSDWWCEGELRKEDEMVVVARNTVVVDLTRAPTVRKRTSTGIRVDRIGTADQPERARAIRFVSSDKAVVESDPTDPINEAREVCELGQPDTLQAEMDNLATMEKRRAVTATRSSQCESRKKRRKVSTASKARFRGRRSTAGRKSLDLGKARRPTVVRMESDLLDARKDSHLLEMSDQARTPESGELAHPNTVPKHEWFRVFEETGGSGTSIESLSWEDALQQMAAEVMGEIQASGLNQAAVKRAGLAAGWSALCAH